MIQVSSVELSGRESAYVNDALESAWISSSGTYVDAFEASFTNYLGTNGSVSCSNGTVALHLALDALGIGPGDEVVVPSLTYVATVNAIRYVGARPVLVDVTPGTLVMNPVAFASAITPATRAVIAVHLYGNPVDMDQVIDLARARGIAVVEDAAEALGSRYRGRMVGTLGDVSTFSFYGNKVITTGEGGMVTYRDPSLGAAVRIRRGQGQDPERRYWHTVVGYNYRLTNLQCAIGLAQLEQVHAKIKRRSQIQNRYARNLGSVPELFTPLEVEPWADAVCWLYTGLVSTDAALTRDELMDSLQRRGIESRPIFYTVNQMPAHRDLTGSFPVSVDASTRGISLPTHTLLSDDDVDLVSETVIELLGGT